MKSLIKRLIPAPTIFQIAVLTLALATILGCDRQEEASNESAAAGTPSAETAVDPQRAAMGEVLDQAAKAQAAGLGKGEVTVNGAWNYTGYSTLSPLPEARLVAVDITVVDHTAQFDFDDIEIADAKLQISYGSDPHLALLTAAGQLQSDPNAPSPVAPAPIRLLLIYGFPRDSQEFDLYYWHKKLNATPIRIQDSGWELPYPSKAPAAP